MFSTRRGTDGRDGVSEGTLAGASTVKSPATGASIQTSAEDAQLAASAAGDTERDAVEPRGEPAGVANGAALFHQNEERGLERVVDGCGVGTQPAAADAQHHGSVAVEQRGERCVIAAHGEAV